MDTLSLLEHLEKTVTFRFLGQHMCAVPLSISDNTLLATPVANSLDYPNSLLGFIN